MKTHPITISGFLIFFIAITGCTSKQLYNAGQDVKCYKYHKYDDIYYQNKCEEVSYQEYQDNREELRNKNKNGS